LWTSLNPYLRAITTNMQHEQITVFDKVIKGGRGKNDANNKAREDILQALTEDRIPPEFYQDQTNGTKWTHIKEGFHQKIHALCPLEFDSYKMTQKAGRKFNYDFAVDYFNLGNIVYSKKLEFKFGAKSIGKLPQFYQKNTNWDIIKGPSYHEYFYDNFLPQILALDPEAPPLVERDVYTKLVMRTDPECHPFFEYLRGAEGIEPVKRKALIQKSIADYLKEYGAEIDLEKFGRTLAETQEGKQYLLYDPISKAFYLEQADFSINSLAFGGIVNNNTIVVNSGKHQFGLLLRWKNRQGVLNTAWQVSVK